jgi:hypothetical protein
MGIDGTTIALIAILGPITFAIGWHYPFRVLITLVLLLPFRDLSIRLLNAFTDIPIATVNSLSRWWFVIVLGLLMVWLVRGIRSTLQRKTLPKLGILDVLLGVIVLMGLIEALLSPDQAAGITSLRGYLQPLVVFVLARSFLPKKVSHIRALHKGFFIVGGVLVVMALWQLATWTEETYRAWGYVDQIGRITGLFRDLGQIGVAFIRPASTVSGPNELGAIMLVFFFLSLLWMMLGPPRYRLIMITLSVGFLVALAVTNSRSVFLGLVAGVTILIFYLVWVDRSSLREYGWKKWLLVLTVALVGLGVTGVILRLTGMLDIVIWSIQNPGGQDHLLESMQALKDILRQPAGVGMGMVGPKGALIFQGMEALYHVEGALFQIAFEWGIWGFVVWMLFLGICLWKNWVLWQDVEAFEIRAHAGMTVLGWVGVLTTFIFLPLNQSVNLMVMLWFILGLGVGLEGKQQRSLMQGNK